MHRDTYVSSPLTENTIWRQMTITLMVMNTFFSSSYLLCLFCFFFYWVFTFSWTPKDELVDGEETLKSLVPPEGVRAKLLAKIEKLKASEQSSFPLPGMTIEIPVEWTTGAQYTNLQQKPGRFKRHKLTRGEATIYN